MSERTDESAAERFSKASCVEQASESLVRANELASVRVVHYEQPDFCRD